MCVRSRLFKPLLLVSVFTAVWVILKVGKVHHKYFVSLYPKENLASAGSIFVLFFYIAHLKL